MENKKTPKGKLRLKKQKKKDRLKQKLEFFLFNQKLYEEILR